MQPGLMDTECSARVLSRVAEQNGKSVDTVEYELLHFVSVRFKVAMSEVAALLHYLASNAARHATGQVIVADGGCTVGKIGDAFQQQSSAGVTESAGQTSSQAAQLHADAIVWDNVWPLEPWCGNDYDALAQFVASGVTVISLTLAGDNHNVSETVQRIGAARRKILANPQQYVLVERIDDVLDAKRRGHLALTFHLEGTRCFERNLDLVELYFRLGIRHALLAFNAGNSVGSGCAERTDGGLTAFGRRLVTEMERVGMLVDLSHTGYRTGLDAIEMSSKPVLFTHSNSAVLHPHFRNVSDEQVRACAATGGVIGVSGSSQYLGDTCASTESILRHIDHYVQTVGPRHVVLGLDLVFGAAAVDDYMRARPEEWPMAQDPAWTGCQYARPSQIPELTEGMLNRGYGSDAVLDILGRNYVRIYGSVLS
jgi:membrane dipeptidase